MFTILQHPMIRRGITLILILCCIISPVKGSGIVFKGTPDVIQSLITDDLTIRCSLSDVSTSSSIIGRRSLGHTDQRSTQADQNIPAADIKFVTSMVITKDGQDIAAITEHGGVRSFVNSSDVTATGQLAAVLGERGYLQVTTKYPTDQQTGNYKCDVTGIDDHGHSFDFSETIEVNEREITMQDLIQQISHMKRDKDVLEQTVQELKHNASYKIVFSVSDPSPSYIPAHQVVKYSRVNVNIGGGYDVTSSVFTSPVDGFYHFEMSALSANNKLLEFDLQLNGQLMMTIWCEDNYGYQMCSDSIALRVHKGDTVKVVARGNSYAFVDPVNSMDEIYSTFNGQLITLA